MPTDDDAPQPRKYAAPRGTSDLLPEAWPYWKFVRDTGERVCALFGYQRIDTPMFENAGVFLRTAGAGTDVVEKEVYLFEDRGGERLALRPEGTATVMRAYIEHGMSSLPQPVRLYYIAPNFRYDRPQAGRYRQHTQLGVEAIGDAEPLIDAEVIDLQATFYRQLGLRGFTLKLNSIGDAVCRPHYIEVLRDYYRPHLDEVCADDRDALREEPAAAARLQGGALPADHRRRAAAARLPLRRLPRCTSRGCRRISTRSGSTTRSTSDWCAGSTTTRARSGSSTRRRKARRAAWAAAAATTASSSCWAARRRRASGSAAGIERLILNLKREEVDVPPAPLPALYIAHLTPEAAAEALKLADAVRAAGRGGDRRAGGTQPEGADASRQRKAGAVRRDHRRPGAGERRGDGAESRGRQRAQAGARRDCGRPWRKPNTPDQATPRIAATTRHN